MTGKVLKDDHKDYTRLVIPATSSYFSGNVVCYSNNRITIVVIDLVILSNAVPANTVIASGIPQCNSTCYSRIWSGKNDNLRLQAISNNLVLFDAAQATQYISGEIVYINAG